MNCVEKLYESTVFFNLYTKSTEDSASQSPWRKSNLEFRYKVIVSSIEFRKGFAKFMILIDLFKKFLS